MFGRKVGRHKVEGVGGSVYFFLSAIGVEVGERIYDLNVFVGSNGGFAVFIYYGGITGGVTRFTIYSTGGCFFRGLGILLVGAWSVAPCSLEITLVVSLFSSIVSAGKDLR